MLPKKFLKVIIFFLFLTNESILLIYPVFVYPFVHNLYFYHVKYIEQAVQLKNQYLT